MSQHTKVLRQKLSTTQLLMVVFSKKSHSLRFYRWQYLIPQGVINELQISEIQMTVLNVKRVKEA